MIDYGLQDKVALVTGAGSGIGAACARALATSPATVALADIDVNAADQLASDLRADGWRAQGFALDVTAPDPVDAVVAAVVAQFGGLNIAVNNAGIGGAAAVTGDVTTADWSRILAVNLNASSTAPEPRSMPCEPAAVDRSSIWPVCSAPLRTGCRRPTWPLNMPLSV